MTNMKRKNNAWSGIGAERGRKDEGTEPVRERSLERKVGIGVGEVVALVGDAERRQ